MRLVRYGERGQERPAVLDSQGLLRDLSGVVRDIDGAALMPDSLDRLRALDPGSLPQVSGPVRLGACVGNVRNIVCIGLNYSDHAAETNTPIPVQPVVFHKHTGALSGPNAPVLVPPGAAKLDWEVELAFVIGRPCWHVPEEQALSHVAGYCVLNDVSERAYQIEMDGQWTKGKSYYSFAPCGPWHRPMPDGGEHALDRVRRSQMVPVLGGEVVKGQQRVAVLHQAGNRPFVFRAVFLGEQRHRRVRRCCGPAPSRSGASRVWRPAAPKSAVCRARSPSCARYADVGITCIMPSSGLC